ncbi:hypothetical protein STCU_06695 [Strigomonas culicis]|uniref:Selenoprotein F/M domain-containing protein n=1 Tax=Strigomonas culicis TaxID=28005 RepID=S9U9F5_9TRYP|nr:hypothetical protein STCU_06695 [Strigomonas culicis]|eukprot:EPY25548.1 hypothetical protein STCU_06695 [Strigomonas culicis]
MQNSPLLLSTAVLLTLFLSSLQFTVAAPLTPQECEALGFESSEVQCQFCDLLQQHTRSDQLYDECKSCCVERTIELTSPANVQYVWAHFTVENPSYYVENKFLGNTLYDFIEQYKNQPYYSQVRFTDSTEPTPRLILWTADMSKSLEVRVRGWSPETMDQFLREKLTLVTNETTASE